MLFFTGSAIKWYGLALEDKQPALASRSAKTLPL